MSAVARRTAAVRATTSRSLRLRVGSTHRMLAAAGMPLARPWRQEQQQAGIARGAHQAALLWVEVGDETRAAGDRGGVVFDLDFAVRDYEPGTLVDLVLLQLLSRGQVDGDETRLG